MPKLTQVEKAKLEVIANGDNPLLAKRAMIVLMSDADVQPNNIAKEVEFTPQTVKRWLREFEKEGFSIFPDLPNGGAASSSAVAYEVETIEPRLAEEAGLEETAEGQEQALLASPKINLTPEDSFAEAGRKVLRFHFERMLKPEPDVRAGGDIEKLHEMRVASRRMRAAFRIFGPAYSKKVTKPLRDGLKELGRVLGPVRDLDVFMENVQQYQQTLPENEQKSLQIVLNTWTKQHRRARKEMLAHLDSKRYTRFKKELQLFVETEGAGAKDVLADSFTPYQLRHVAASLIYRAYEQVRAYESLPENAPAETLHQLRIEFKRFRYLLEFLEEVLGEEVKLIIQETKVMQDYLGSLQDAEVANKILKEFLTDWEGYQAKTSPDERQSADPLISYRQARQEERRRLFASFPEAWANFNRHEVRQSLAQAVSVL
jgi:CHAD domain-containing protein